MSRKRAPDKRANAKGTQKSAKSTTKQAAKKAAARPGPRADKESAVIAMIAKMPPFCFFTLVIHIRLMTRYNSSNPGVHLFALVSGKWLH